MYLFDFFHDARRRVTCGWYENGYRYGDGERYGNGHWQRVHVHRLGNVHGNWDRYDKFTFEIVISLTLDGDHLGTACDPFRVHDRFAHGRLVGDHFGGGRHNDHLSFVLSDRGRGSPVIVTVVH